MNEAAKKLAKRTADVSLHELTQRLDHLSRVIDQQSELIKALKDTLIGDKPPPKAKKLDVMRADATSALRARVGHAASSRGWTYQEWLDRFGLREWKNLSPKEQAIAERGPVTSA